MSNKPKSSIDWERKFSLPVAVGLDLDDMSSAGLDMDTYFTNAKIKAMSRAIGDDTLDYQLITGENFLLPPISNAPDLESAAIAEGSVNAISGTTPPVETEFFDLDPAQRIQKYYDKTVLSLNHRQAEFLPMPYDAPSSLHISWGTGATSTHATMTGSFDGIDLEAGILGYYYGLETSSASAGELNPELIRSMMSGLVRFERYQHYEKQGDGSLKGNIRSNSGRLIFLDPDFITQTYDSAEGRVLKTITGLAFEHVDATYSFSSPGSIVSRPLLATHIQGVLSLHLANFNTFDATLLSAEIYDSTEKEKIRKRISGVGFSFLEVTLVNVLRSWAAYSIFVTETSELTDLSTPELDLLKSSEAIDTASLAMMIFELQSSHTAGSSSSSWAKLHVFMENVLVPFYLGISWMELGVDLDLLPAYNDDGTGWWRTAGNEWGMEVLTNLEMNFRNTIPIWAGAPLGSPAPYFMQNTADLDGETQLEDGTGLTLFDLEAMALSDTVVAETGIGAVSLPSQLYEHIDPAEFSALEVGNHMTLRPYKVKVEDGVASIQTVPYEYFIGELIETGLGAPALDPTDEYVNHPLFADGLAVLPLNYHVLARRDDGDQTNLEAGQVIEVRVTLDYSLQSTYIQDTVLQNLENIYFRITAVDGGSTYSWTQLLDETEKVAYEDGGFQETRYVTARLEELTSEWKEEEQVDDFLVRNVLSYENQMLILDQPGDDKVSFYVWFFADQVTGPGVKDLDLSISLFYDTDELELVEPSTEQLSNVASGDTTFPGLFEEATHANRKFSIPRSSTFNTSNGKTDLGGTFHPHAEYLNQFVWGEGGDDTEAAHTLYEKYQIGFLTKETITDNLGDRADAVGDDNTATVFRDPFWKMYESYSAGSLSNGIYNQLLPAKFHDRLRIVQEAHDEMSLEFTDAGLPASNALPINAILSLWVIESGLNLAPSLPALRLGIPPVGHGNERITVFAGATDFNDIIGDLIYVQDAGFMGVSEATFNAFSKSKINQLKGAAVQNYVLNLLSMDAYNGFTAGFVSSASQLEIQKHGFVKTMLHTRQQNGLLKKSGLASDDLEWIKRGYERWYQMAGEVNLCFGFVPRHGKSMGFGAAKNGTALQKLWIHEAAHHFNACIRGRTLTGFEFTNDLPNVLAYVRFNWGEVNFLKRVFEIIHNTYEYAVREYAKVGHGEIMSIAEYTVEVQDFLKLLATEHFDPAAVAISPVAAAAAAAAFSKAPNFAGTNDLTKVRRQDTDTSVGASDFDAVEAKILARDLDLTTGEDYVTTVLLGSVEGSMATHFEANPGDLNTMLTWVDADPVRWEALGEFFRTEAGQFVPITGFNSTIVGAAGITATKLSHYETARWFQHRFEAFEDIFA